VSYIDKSIIIGFHAHDNRGLAAANAILFLSEMSNNELDYIVDSSINGMGRGAGNLKTEYLMDELIARGKNYDLTPLFEVIDNYFNIYHLKKSWGYSLNKHLSGRMNIHPNYAIFLEEIGLLTHIQVNNILTKIDSSKRSKYDEEYISKLYIEAIASNPNKNYIPNFKDKEVWIIAPGNENNIFEAKFDLNDNVILLSVNHQPEIFAPDYTFITKIKRYNKNYIQSKSELIITDDIEVVDSKYIVSRTSLMNDFDSVEDNAGLMAISLALIAGASKISLIGFDGYKKDRRNVIDSLIDVTFSSKKIDRINKGMLNAIQSYSRLIKIDFLTPSLYSLKQRNTAK
jgi:4-hydroxy 2-oxovalerate aldolase